MERKTGGWVASGRRWAVVLVVPREHALTVGRLAREIYVGDEKSGGQRYQKLGIPLDETVNVK